LTLGARRRRPLGGSENGGRLSYNDIRDQFLAELPKTAQEELEYFTRIGMFVFYRWQAIASDHAQGETIDEGACDHRWDECTEQNLTNIREDARELIGEEVGRQRAFAFVVAWFRRIEPIRAVSGKVEWVLMRIWEHFVGAIGLLAFGLIFVWLAPQVARHLRTTSDEMLPAETRPQDLMDDRGNLSGAAENRTAEGTP